MLRDIDIENILFLDIETVPACADYSELPANMKKLWDHKAEFLKKTPDDNPERLYGRAGIYAEFGRIVCISAGFFKGREFRVKSYYGDDEFQLLGHFCKLLNASYSAEGKLLCAHNGKEFDFPYLARRILIHGIPLPAVLDTAGQKPWLVRHLDTMELWRFGDYKNFTSLELLAAIFDIPTPKDDISGADISRVYWQEHDLERIRTYCQKDVVTIARLFLKYQQQPGLPDEAVVVVA